MVDVPSKFLGCHFLARNFLSLTPEECATRYFVILAVMEAGGAGKKYQTALLGASASCFVECGFTDTATKSQTALSGATAPCYVEC